MNNLFVICQNYLEEEYGVDIASHLSNIFYDKQIEYTDNTLRLFLMQNYFILINPKTFYLYFAQKGMIK